jgi:hypothetical protein
MAKEPRLELLVVAVRQRSVALLAATHRFALSR